MSDFIKCVSSEKATEILLMIDLLANIFNVRSSGQASGARLAQEYTTTKSQCKINAELRKRNESGKMSSDIGFGNGMQQGLAEVLETIFMFFSVSSMKWGNW